MKLNDRHETKYLTFSRLKHQDKRTYDVRVLNKYDELLGFIYWRVGWRRYVFEPKENMIFDTNCLKDIIEYIQQLTEEKEKIENGIRF